jgi:hypothetical protein
MRDEKLRQMPSEWDRHRQPPGSGDDRPCYPARPLEISARNQDFATGHFAGSWQEPSVRRRLRGGGRSRRLTRLYT